MAFHDPTEHIQTREAFDVAVNAVEEIEFAVLQPDAITSPDEITEDLTYALAFFPMKATPGPPRHGQLVTIAKWSGNGDDELQVRIDDLEACRKELEHTLRKLVLKRRRIDVAAVINALYAARWRYVEYRLQCQSRLVAPSLPPMAKRPDTNPFHQELLGNLRRTLKRLGVSGADVTSLFRCTGLRDLTGTNRPDPALPRR